MSEMPEGRQYEFDEHEDAVFRDLAGAMRFVGRAMLLAGPLLVIVGVSAVLHKEYASAVGQVATGASLFLIGNWTGDAAQSIARIHSTHGNDITNLVSAMVDFRKIYDLQRKLLTVIIVVMVVAIGLAILTR